MTLDEIARLTQKCEKALEECGATPALKKFCLEVVEYEHETSGASLRMHEKLRRLNVDGLDSLELLIERMIEDFARWTQRLDGLVASGKSLPPLEASKLQGCKLQAPTSIQTSQIHVDNGESFTVTDASKPNVIKIRTQDGKEDNIPILTYILQNPDEAINSLLKRLLVQLLSLWTDCLNQSGKILHRSALRAFHSLKIAQSEYAKVEAGGSAINLRLKKFGEILKQAGVEQVEKQGGKIKAKTQDLVGRLVKSIAAYEKFFEHWNNFRLQLKACKPEPICIFETIDDLRKHTSDNGRLKCFTTTFTVESTEIREETTHIPMGDFDDDTSSCGGGGYWRQLIETEQLTSVSQEEKKRYIVKSVKDPRSGKDVSLREAIQDGIIDMRLGIYRNPVTQESVAIAVALSDGKIQIDYVTKTRSMPKTEALGLIKVRDRIGSRSYTITAVVDAVTAERVSLTEAKRRGLLDEDATVYTLNTTGEDIPMQDAVDSGWVLVDYDPEDEAGSDEAGAGTEQHEYRTKTYAVRAVVDQRQKKRVPFLEAVRRKLVDRETGNYYNNLTGETVHALEAIRLGFLKANVIEDSTKMDMDPTNKMVVQSIGKMKCLVTGLGALSAMKESANRLSTSSVESP